MFEVQKLPPKEGLGNRAVRFVLQMADKLLYPDSNKVVGGGEYVAASHSLRPEITQREMNDVAREHDIRRYNRFGVGDIVGQNNLPEIYKGLAKGSVHVIEPIESKGDRRVIR